MKGVLVAYAVLGLMCAGQVANDTGSFGQGLVAGATWPVGLALAVSHEWRDLGAETDNETAEITE